ncbi:MAG: HypC/HybG/HupF family hydrogenase formation chaperone [Sporomusaceae bacterium]|nr:HypC/HybG/HupF family hydrogenase formation chaperone [Sporomusaceae bacterium]
MCLAVPGKILSREEYSAEVDVTGVTRQISLMLLPEAAIGDYVLIHAGFAIQVIDAAEAEKTMELFREIAAHEAI